MLLDDCYISYLNLDHREDRNQHMIDELAKVGITATRTSGKKPEEYDLTDEKLKVMYNRTKGAIGCHYGQVSIMAEALRQNKHSLVMEDDLVFCSDFNERIKIIEEFMATHHWDIFWLGGTFHANNPAWWHCEGHSLDLQQCKCDYGKDAEHTDDKRFVKTYGCFCTYCYIVNKNFIKRLLEFLEDNVHLSMGIDWLMILLQPHIDSYAFVPGCVKQMDSQSDIGNGITYFSGFKMLGEHWWQDKMGDFNYDNFKL